jgi:hypothetical protein
MNWQFADDGGDTGRGGRRMNCRISSGQRTLPRCMFTVPRTIDSLDGRATLLRRVASCAFSRPSTLHRIALQINSLRGGRPSSESRPLSPNSPTGTLRETILGRPSCGEELLITDLGFAAPTVHPLHVSHSQSPTRPVGHQSWAGIARIPSTRIGAGAPRFARRTSRGTVHDRAGDSQENR